MSPMRNVRVVDYDPAWPDAFRREAVVLAGILGEELIAIYHIGSTSVPGLRAKPIIDIMPVVRAIERIDLYDQAMAAAGYCAWGEYGIPGRRFFTKGGDVGRTHNVHIFQAADPGIARHLAVPRYLVAHPAAAAQYADLKTALAMQFPHDIQGYMDGKDAFVKELEAKALAWEAEQAETARSRT